MTEFNYGDIIEYIDGTYDENFNAAKKWAREHKTTFVELVDRREEKEKEETYTDLEGREIVVPAQTHDEIVPAEYDEEGNLIKEEGIVTVIDVPEHTEVVPVEVEKTRTIKVLHRFFQIGQEYAPTEDEIKEKMISIRDSYFSQYVDWYQSKPLLWEEMDEEEKEKIKGYRQYLKEYNDQEDWWKAEPLDYNDWLIQTKGE